MDVEAGVDADRKALIAKRSGRERPAKADSGEQEEAEAEAEAEVDKNDGTPMSGSMCERAHTIGSSTTLKQTPDVDPNAADETAGVDVDVFVAG